MPAATPAAVVGKIASAFQYALDSAEVKQRIAQLGGEIQRTTPEQAQAFIEQQVSLWGRVIKERRISAD
jgi:tripartite-type tricarboxylate transporter receptor subunit TctC